MIDTNAKVVGIGEDIEIPRDIFVRCPLIQFKLRQARKCDGCEHFRGITLLIHDDNGVPIPEQAKAPGAFRRMFAVGCAYPMDRELYQVEIEDN
jgi:hypothetical protein